MKKTISAVLLAAFLLSVISCGESADAKAETTATPAGAEETTAAETNILDYLPASNFNGQTFTILTRIGAEFEFEAPEHTGDLINDAIYQRNMTVEERYNTKIKTIARKSDWGAADTFNSELKALLMAGDQSFNIVAGGMSMIPGQSVGRIYGEQGAVSGGGGTDLRKTERYGGGLRHPSAPEI